MSHPIVILGSGYTGRYLASALAKGSRRYFASSREPANHLPHVPQTQRIQFDFGQQETWKNIPQEADLIWCFPATPLEQVQAFARTLDAPPRRIVVLGSTSAYDAPSQSTGYPPPWIDESAPIDLTKPRVQGEEYLRKEQAAIVLRVAGIYGPGRNPLDWIRQGRIGPSRKYVNLIHAEDLASICLLALDKGKPGEAYNVSDGTPRTWEDVCRTAQTRWGIAATGTQKNDETGKRISTDKLVRTLQPRLQHSDLYANLQALK